MSHASPKFYPRSGANGSQRTDSNPQAPSSRSRRVRRACFAPKHPWDDILEFGSNRPGARDWRAEGGGKIVKIRRVGQGIFRVRFQGTGSVFNKQTILFKTSIGIVGIFSKISEHFFTTFHFSISQAMTALFIF